MRFFARPAVILVFLVGGCLVVKAVPATVTVAIPQEVRAENAPIVLHIDRLKLPPRSSGIVRIFGDLRSATAETSVDDEHFLGYVSLLAKTSADAVKGIQSDHVTLDVSQKRRLFANKTEIAITLVPLGSADAPEAPTFERIYLAVS